MKYAIHLLMTVTCLGLSAQSLDQILGYKFHYGLVSSPDVDNPAVAYVENKEGIRNLYYQGATDASPKKLTNYTEDDGQDISGIAFTDSALYYVYGGSPNRVGEFPNPTSDPKGTEQAIYKVRLVDNLLIRIDAGTNPLPFGKGILYLKKGAVFYYCDEGGAKQLFQMRGGVTNLRLSPDHSKLAFISNRGDHSYASLYHFSDSSLQIIQPSVDLDRNVVWSPDGSQLAYFRFPHETPKMFAARREALPFSIVTVTLASGEVKTVWTAEEGTGSAYRVISAKNPLMWMANGSLVFPWEKMGWTHLYALNPSSGRTTLLTPGQFEVQFVSMAPNKRSIVYSSNQGDLNRQHVWMIDNQLKVSQLSSGKGIQWSPVITGEKVYCHGSGGVTPASVMRILDDKLTVIAGSENYPSHLLVVPDEIVYESADGMKIHGQLFRPKNIKKTENRPAIIFLHGGSRRQMLAGFHHRGYYHNTYAMNQFLASKGYVVLSINYRSGIGYGMKFREALNYGAGGASEFNDVLGAGLYLKNLPYIDADKVGLYGGSYGGYLTAMGLSRASDMFAAGVDIHGVMDWNAIIQGFNPDYNPLEHPEFAEVAYESSPAASMSGWKSPVLLIHGDDDRNVPFSETVDKIEQLRKYGVYFEQLVFPDEVHGFLLHKNWKAAFEATYDFFERKLKQ